MIEIEQINLAIVKRLNNIKRHNEIIEESKNKIEKNFEEIDKYNARIFALKEKIN
jgi:hypothetical protein